MDAAPGLTFVDHKSASMTWYTDTNADGTGSATLTNLAGPTDYPAVTYRYVNTDASAGGDGTTTTASGSTRGFALLNTAFSDALTNKVRGQPWTIICSAPSGVADATSAVTGAIAVSEGGSLIVRANAGNEGGTMADQRQVVVWSTSIYRLRTTSGTTGSLKPDIDDIQIYDIQVENTAAGTNGAKGIYSTTAKTRRKIERCLIRGGGEGGTSEASNAYGIFLEGSGGTQVCYIANNIVFNFGGSAPFDTDLAGGISCKGTTARISGNTVVNCFNGIVGPTGTSYTEAKENLVSGSPSEDFHGNFVSAQTYYNTSEDGTATGTGSRVNQTVTYANEGGLDFRLSSSDTSALGFGLDLSGDVLYPLVLDVSRATRATPFNIGADDVTAAAGAGQPAARRKGGVVGTVSGPGALSGASRW
jgi:hypothetical protein